MIATCRLRELRGPARTRIIGVLRKCSGRIRRSCRGNRLLRSRFVFGPLFSASGLVNVLWVGPRRVLPYSKFIICSLFSSRFFLFHFFARAVSDSGRGMLPLPDMLQAPCLTL